MTALAILLIFALIADMLSAWVIGAQLRAMRDDLHRIEAALERIAEAVGVEDELEDAWPDSKEIYFADYPVTGGPEL